MCSCFLVGGIVFTVVESSEVSRSHTDPHERLWGEEGMESRIGAFYVILTFLGEGCLAGSPKGLDKYEFG